MSENTRRQGFAADGSRSGHMAIAKRRALEYCDAGDAHRAVTSIASDVSKHPDSAGHPGIQPLYGLLLGQADPGKLRAAIEALI